MYLLKSMKKKKMSDKMFLTLDDKLEPFKEALKFMLKTEINPRQGNPTKT